MVSYSHVSLVGNLNLDATVSGHCELATLSNLTMWSILLTSFGESLILDTVDVVPVCQRCIKRRRGEQCVYISNPLAKVRIVMFF